ncbi:condensation domain-containing protein [Legionella sp. PATHC038]|uniref:condensation domain-containing protein n=1 Tax=Legionella sheltonii TaxID=2992041 RepID=UPI002244D3E2|nr:condensation domain-containing protein [Legionella sp. PATHC038]MCW8399471.1 condensation domain-containing protein [Legionella sp. PATHC038]
MKRINQRIDLIARRILALPAATRHACLDEIQANIATENWLLLQSCIKTQVKIIDCMSHPNKIPLSFSQLMFWSMELTSRYSKNEVTSCILEGRLDIEKVERAINHIANQFDIFNYRVKNWLPEAKKTGLQKIKLNVVRFYTSNSPAQQLEEINHTLAHIDLRKLKQNIYPILIIMDDNNSLLQLVITHKAIDTKTKLMLWQIFWRNYQGIKDSHYTPYKNYIYNERSYYSERYNDLIQHIKKDFDEYSPCKINPEIIDKDTEIKPRLIYSLNKRLAALLKEFCFKQEFTMDELIISSILQAFRPYCSNNDYLVQIISQPLFYSNSEQILGPCLNERSFAGRHTATNLIEFTKEIRNHNRQSINYANLPYGAALGWLYYRKYGKKAVWLSTLLHTITKLLKYADLNKNITNCYAGLILYEFFANKNKEFPLISFNFRNTFSERKYPKEFSTENLQLRPYFYPLYHNTVNYVSVNIDAATDEGIAIHIESFFKEEIDKEIMQAALNHLRSYIEP